MDKFSVVESYTMGGCSYITKNNERCSDHSVVEYIVSLQEENDHLRVGLEEAHMAGQGDAGVDPSYSNAQVYAIKCKAFGETMIERGTYYWTTEEPHRDNGETMRDWICCEKPTDCTLDNVNDTCCEVFWKGDRYLVQASGSGDFNSHKVEFSLIGDK